jgi:hypothetical protein
VGAGGDVVVLTWANVADAPAGQVSSPLPNSMNACVERTGVSQADLSRAQRRSRT